MNKESLHNIKAWFRTYTRRYTESNGEFHQVLNMKLIHSGRVATECRDIAAELGWNENDVLVAEAVGILHDVARFPQFHRYRTLHDPVSINHGEAAFEIVAADPSALRDCTPEERSIILDSIRLHNRREIPADVPPASMRFVKLIRDADKLDILQVIEDAIRNNLVKDYPELVLNIDLNGPPTPALVDQVLKHKSASYSNMKTFADLHILRVTWVYDINYLPTLRRLIGRKLLSGLLETMPSSPTPAVRQIVRQADDYAQAKLAAGNPILI